MEDKFSSERKLFQIIQHLIYLIAVLLVLLIVVPILFYNADSLTSLFNSTPKLGNKPVVENAIKNESSAFHYWKAPDITTISDSIKKAQVAYGKELIIHTSKYLGPKGTVLKISNGMNCQNCHLEAGTKIFGNNYSSVAALYPKFRARSGAVETIYKRVNDCFERSLNGKALDTLGSEMQAIRAYIEFIGSTVAKGKKAEGSGFKEMAFLTRACSPEKGKEVYVAKCQSCHQQNGEGTLPVDGSEYTYPPLWGMNSYNDGAGLYRISNFAKYAKYNMPFGATHESAQLSDDEAWDVAAFVNSQTRPHKNTKQDWPDISKKPIDHPFGPYADNFSEIQHKYGPYQSIADAQKMRDATKQKLSVASK